MLLSISDCLCGLAPDSSCRPLLARHPWSSGSSSWLFRMGVPMTWTNRSQWSSSLSSCWTCGTWSRRELYCWFPLGFAILPFGCSSVAPKSVGPGPKSMGPRQSRRTNRSVGVLHYFIFLPFSFISRLFLTTWTCWKPPKNVLVVGRLLTSPIPKMLLYFLCWRVWWSTFRKPSSAPKPASTKFSCGFAGINE